MLLSELVGFIAYERADTIIGKELDSSKAGKWGL